MDHNFEKVLENNKASIYRICHVYAQSPVEPKDLFQEVVFQIWKSFPNFKNKSSISTWVYRIALNVCQRYKMKLDKRNLNLTRLDSIHFSITENVFEWDSQEKYEALYDCISYLNDGERTIVILFLEELPYKEIALILGLTENHVAVKMKRIKKKLFECINQKI